MKNTVLILISIFTLFGFTEPIDNNVDVTFECVCAQLIDDPFACQNCPKQMVFTGLRITNDATGRETLIPAPVKFKLKNDTAGNLAYVYVNGVKYDVSSITNVSTVEEIETLSQCILGKGPAGDIDTFADNPQIDGTGTGTIDLADGTTVTFCETCPSYSIADNGLNPNGDQTYILIDADGNQSGIPIVDTGAEYTIVDTGLDADGNQTYVLQDGDGNQVGDTIVIAVPVSDQIEYLDNGDGTITETHTAADGTVETQCFLKCLEITNNVDDQVGNGIDSCEPYTVDLSTGDTPCTDSDGNILPGVYTVDNVVNANVWIDAVTGVATILPTGPNGQCGVQFDIDFDYSLVCQDGTTSTGTFTDTRDVNPSFTVEKTNDTNDEYEGGSFDEQVPFVYFIEIINTGTGDLLDVEIVDPTPSGLINTSFIVFPFQAPDIPEGESYTLAYEVTPDGTDASTLQDIENIVTVNTSNAGSETAVNIVSEAPCVDLICITTFDNNSKANVRPLTAGTQTGLAPQIGGINGVSSYLDEFELAIDNTSGNLGALTPRLDVGWQLSEIKLSCEGFPCDVTGITTPFVNDGSIGNNQWLDFGAKLELSLEPLILMDAVFAFNSPYITVPNDNNVIRLNSFFSIERNCESCYLESFKVRRVDENGVPLVSAGPLGGDVFYEFITKTTERVVCTPPDEVFPTCN